jgi:hypothetical protein
MYGVQYIRKLVGLTLGWSSCLLTPPSALVFMIDASGLCF